MKTSNSKIKKDACQTMLAMEESRRLDQWHVRTNLFPDNFDEKLPNLEFFALMNLNLQAFEVDEGLKSPHPELNRVYNQMHNRIILQLVRAKKNLKSLPGHLRVLQILDSVSGPRLLQSLPPFSGRGFVQERERC